MIAAPTFSQIKAQVEAIRKRSPRSQVIGIHTQGRWTGDRQQQVGNQPYRIDQCDSPLALRIALQKGDQERATDQNLIQVIVTPLSDDDIEADICLRLAKQRLFTITPWQIVKSLFSATNIDPRLIQHSWIPEALMDAIPGNGYPPVLGGFLDAEIVWPILLHQHIHLQANRPDLPALLAWSTHPENVERYQQTSPDFRTAAADWLIGLAGSTAKTILHCAAHSQKPDALPLGLAAAVIYHPAAQGKLDKAIGKLEERFLAGHSPSPETMRRWSKAAHQSLQPLPAETRYALIQRSDAILTEIGAQEFAYLSTISERGFDQHLTSFSKQLTALVKKPSPTHLNKLKKTYQTLQSHEQIEPLSRRIQRVEMALRLAQWLVSDRQHPPAETQSEPQSLEEAIAYHTDTGSLLDWARLTLPLAEPNPDLCAAYGQLFNTITHIRETQSHQFANLLKDWTEVGSTQTTILPIENVLDAVIAPLAEKDPVLLIVIDGMSLAVCHELLSTLEQPWHLIRPIQPALATIPSITATSRTSLFCGQIQSGKAPQETQGFTAHPSLLKYCKRDAPPLLFHKAALQSTDSPTLAADLRSAIESDQHQIVALVINAVDDLLSKGDQIDTSWTFEHIKVLKPILQSALNASRVVILTSDHGHILHNSTQYQPGDGGERWRTNSDQPSEQELQIKGKRVLIEGSAAIAPWTEKIRYSPAKKHGYHGGINPQEMIVPIAILASPRSSLSGSSVAVSLPDWWKSPLDLSELAQPQQTQALSENDFGPLFTYTGSDDL
ncbi:MAG: BREX-2 system phosphatase PglZ [Phormidesmis sp.]